jgi:hypothetical protein
MDRQRMGLDRIREGLSLLLASELISGGGDAERKPAPTGAGAELLRSAGLRHVEQRNALSGHCKVHQITSF